MKIFLRVILWVWLISLAPSLVFSQTPTAKPAASQEPQTFALWENGAPGALGHEDSDIPTLTYYPALRGIPTAVIVAPGGGYQGLAMNHEGRQVANWLNAVGIAAFVLKYRLGPRYHHPIELGDAQRAIRLVRTRAAEYGVKPDRIGMMGFLAGGHLTSTAETHFDSGNPNAPDPIDRASSRRFRHPGLPGDFLHGALYPSRFRPIPAGRFARSQAFGRPLYRSSRHSPNASYVSVQHQ